VAETEESYGWLEGTYMELVGENFMEKLAAKALALEIHVALTNLSGSELDFDGENFWPILQERCEKTAALRSHYGYHAMI
jgi:hypothetical protein